MIRTSGGIVFPSEVAFSQPGADVADEGLALERFLELVGLVDDGPAGRDVGPFLLVASIRARMRPWARMRTRPSGSFSIRMTRATVPIS